MLRKIEAKRTPNVRGVFFCYVERRAEKHKVLAVLHYQKSHRPDFSAIQEIAKVNR